MQNVNESYLEFTADLLQSKRTFGSLHQFSTFGAVKTVKEMEARYNDIFSWKTLPKMGQDNVPFGTWLIESVFPSSLYKQNGSKLSKLLGDSRFSEAPSNFHNHDTYHNFLGRLARRRSVAGSKYVGFLDYLLDRWKRDNHRSMPHFYFSIEDPDWVFAELMRNTNQIKSGRTAVSCVMNMCFRWNPKEKQLVLSIILKHTQWHHTIGDFCGGALIAQAVAKEVGEDPNNCVVNIFLPSASLDYPKEAKAVVRQFQQQTRRIKA
jgi:hypothetical protein